MVIRTMWKAQVPFFYWSTIYPSYIVLSKSHTVLTGILSTLYVQIRISVIPPTPYSFHDFTRCSRHHFSSSWQEPLPPINVEEDCFPPFPWMVAHTATKSSYQKIAQKSLPCDNMRSCYFHSYICTFGRKSVGLLLVVNDPTILCVIALPLLSILRCRISVNKHHV